jgi:hypothetical protein
MRRHLLSLLCLVAAFIGVVSAQSNPAGRAGRANALDEATSLPTKLTPAAQALSVSFAKPVVYGSGGSGPRSLAVADLNNDGYLDIVVANQCPLDGYCPNGQVSVLLGNAQGTFQSPALYSSGGVYANSVVIVDLRRNGIQDLVVTNQCQDSTCDNGGVSVLLGNGDGTFQAAASYNSGGYGTNSVAVGDLNGDGVLDLVLTNECPVASQDCSQDLVDSTISVFLGKGDGTFQTPVSYDSGGVAAGPIALSDLNGDGSLDIVAGHLCSAPEFYGCIGVFLNNGDGTFQPPANIVAFQPPGQATSFGITDLNGDGVPDVAMSNLSGGVGVLLGNGDGTFQNVALYGSGGAGGSNGLAIGDLNGDGIPDLVASNLCRTLSKGAACMGSSDTGVLVGNGNGTFLDAVSYSSGGIVPISVVSADVNGDGRPDLIVANVCNKYCENGTIGVLLNKTSRAPTTTTLTSSSNPSQVNQAVTFTATITSSRIIPDGQVVQFYDGTVEMGMGSTTKGVATFVTSFSKAKTYAIKAKYAGGGFLGASSGTVKQKVVNPE